MSLTLRFLIAVALLCTAGWFAVVKPVLARVERQYLEAAEEPMVDLANLLAEIAAGSWNDGDPAPDLTGALRRARAREFEARIYDLVKTRVDLHITLADARGIVLMDSMDSARVGKPHGYRDVRLTLEGSYGARSSRMDPSDPLSAVMHIAAPVRDESGQLLGVLSVAKPQRDMLVFIEHTRSRVKAFALAGAAAAFLLAILLALWIAEPLRKLTRHAEAVASGGRPPAPRLPGRHLARLGRMIEEMRDALEGKRHVETYVRNLTHEMKSPVAAIRGAVELLQDPLPDEQRRKLLANIDGESQRLEALSGQLLDLANLENRKQLEATEPIDAAAIVRSVVDAKFPAAQNHRIALDVVVRENPRPHGDATLIELAIANLLQNAIDFAPEQSTVAIEIRRDGADAVIEITDSGPGLPGFAIDRVFERFYSLPRPRTGRKSSGLGLCFVRETAELHGGTITLESAKPTGTRAVLRLPVASRKT
ncbi:MAG: two-component system sensor histidine kinase CreC [Luteolibacter sp.]